MTGPVRPAGPSTGAEERRTGDRRDRDGERRSGTPRASRDLIPVDREAAPVDPAPETILPGSHTARPVEASPTAFAAQIMGQTGQKRGLRGGAPVLDAARSAYLETEYAGPKDRRPAPGGKGKTEI